jgi:hypothetical protein
VFFCLFCDLELGQMRKVKMDVSSIIAFRFCGGGGGVWYAHCSLLSFLYFEEVCCALTHYESMLNLVGLLSAI